MTRRGDHPPACRLCGAAEAESLGTIADSDFFAGRVLSQPLPGGRLWRCRHCDSMFRHPILASEAYLRLYQEGAPEQWSGEGNRRDLQLVRAIIAVRPGVQTVLDVGCGTGDFLTSLPGPLARFGIEPSTAAAAQAAARGVSIAGSSVERLPPEMRFDVITLIDVIEHLPDPAAMLDLLCRHLSANGIAIISTGDPQCVAWRVLKSRFWYSSFPEHISFPSHRFFEQWQADGGAGPLSKRHTRYRHLPYWQWALYGIIQAGYFVSPSLFNWAGRAAGRLGWLQPQRRFFSPGVPGLFVDHQVVTIQRAAQVDALTNRKSA
jgi:SAM-dependent methyltransferase